MKKILLTITILTLTALAGVLWFSQNNNQTKPSALNIERNKEIEESNKITTKNEDKLQNNQPENNLKEQEEKQSRLTLAQQAEDLGVKLLPNGEIDTGDWKEYRNESCGFAVKVPGEWEIYGYDCSNLSEYYSKADVLTSIKLIPPEYIQKKIDPEFRPSPGVFRIDIYPRKNVSTSRIINEMAKGAKKVSQSIFTADIIAYEYSEGDYRKDYIIEKKRFPLEVLYKDNRDISNTILST